MSGESRRRPTSDDVDFDGLCDRARRLARDAGRSIIGIVGAPGAGKTLLAVALREALTAAPPEGVDGSDWIAHVPMDGFHLANAELDRLGLRHVKGSPDTFDAFGYASVLRRLASERDAAVYAPDFDRRLDEPIAGSIHVSPRARMVITEGNYLLLDRSGWLEARACLSEVWFCDTDESRRLHQLVARHVSYGRTQDEATSFALTSDEANARLTRRAREHSDLVIPERVMAGLSDFTPEAATRDRHDARASGRPAG